jgi:hypothetical protein
VTVEEDIVVNRAYTRASSGIGGPGVVTKGSRTSIGSSRIARPKEVPSSSLQVMKMWHVRHISLLE